MIAWSDPKRYVIVGLNPPRINPGADVNGDGKIGLAEMIYILQKVAGFR